MRALGHPRSGAGSLGREGATGRTLLPGGARRRRRARVHVRARGLPSRADVGQPDLQAQLGAVAGRARTPRARRREQRVEPHAVLADAEAAPLAQRALSAACARSSRRTRRPAARSPRSDPGTFPRPVWSPPATTPLRTRLSGSRATAQARTRRAVQSPSRLRYWSTTRSSRRRAAQVVRHRGRRRVEARWLAQRRLPHVRAAVAARGVSSCDARISPCATGWSLVHSKPMPRRNRACSATAATPGSSQSVGGLPCARRGRSPPRPARDVAGVEHNAASRPRTVGL